MMGIHFEMQRLRFDDGKKGGNKRGREEEEEDLGGTDRQTN
jgi:hypothetical protein